MMCQILLTHHRKLYPLEEWMGGGVGRKVGGVAGKEGVGTEIDM